MPNTATPLATYLAGLTPLHVADVMWSVRLRQACYATKALPPDALVTSIRGMVFKDDAVLVVTDKSGERHLIPGGRREAGETYEQTLRREIGEETGWTVKPTSVFAVMHFHHLDPAPRDWPHLHPDFLQLVWLAEAIEHRPELREDDGFEIASEFLAIADARTRAIHAPSLALLDAALQVRA